MWYHRYICTAHTLGIANGFSDGNFKPNDSVTTLEALAFGNKAFGLNVATTGDKWYEALQQFAESNNIMATHGYHTDISWEISRPHHTITRIFTDEVSPLLQEHRLSGMRNTIRRKYNYDSVKREEI